MRRTIKKATSKISINQKPEKRPSIKKLRSLKFIKLLIKSQIS
jgi:hypothetical protein